MLMLKVVRLTHRLRRKLFGRHFPHYIKDTIFPFPFFGIIRALATVEAVVFHPGHFYRRMEQLLSGKKPQYMTPIQFLVNISIIQFLLLKVFGIEYTVIANLWGGMSNWLEPLGLFYAVDWLVDIAFALPFGDFSVDGQLLERALIAANSVVVIFAPIFIPITCLVLVAFWLAGSLLYPRFFNFNSDAFVMLKVAITPRIYAALNWKRFFWCIVYYYWYFIVVLLVLLFFADWALFIIQSLQPKVGHSYGAMKAMGRLFGPLYGAVAFGFVAGGAYLLVKPYIMMMLSSVRRPVNAGE